jgi:serine/threonine protein phosphatase 1
MKQIAVIGDIHGCLDELEILMDKYVLPHIDKLEHIVFVGDYIDRGPKSKQVFDYCQKIPKVIMLKGNHEDMMSDPNQEFVWFNNGGRETVNSYSNPEDINNDAKLMEKLRTSFKFGRVVVSHACMDPSLSLEEQSEHDLIWSRDFVGYKGTYKDNNFNIFGHTPMREILERPNQLGIDTGCVFGYKLSAVIIDENAEVQMKFSVNKVK